jgi:hypothetical protein
MFAELDPRTRWGAFAVAVTLATAAFVGRPAPVTAECDGPFPSFRELTKTAATIVVGHVVAVHPGGAWDPLQGGVASRFTLGVEYVLRGQSPAFAEIDDLPTQPCASVIGARLGDQIALAIGGRAFEPPVPANMVAWIDAVPPPGFGGDVISPAESYSLDAVFALVGMEPPASIAPDAPAAIVAPATTVVPLGGVIAALLVVIAALLVVIGAAAVVVRGRRRDRGLDSRDP